jgi:hypothetical protein
MNILTVQCYDHEVITTCFTFRKQRLVSTL